MISSEDPSFRSQHLYAFHVDGIPLHVSGDGNVMAFMSFEGIGIIYREDFVIAVCNQHCAGAAFDDTFWCKRRRWHWRPWRRTWNR